MATLSTAVLQAYSDLEAKVRATLQTEYDSGRLTGDDYGKVLASALGNVMNTAVQIGSRDVIIDEQILQLNAQTSKIGKDEDLVDQQILNAVKEGAFLDSRKTLTDNQSTQLTQSVEDNRLINAIKAVGDSNSTFGAGGLAVGDEQFEAFYGLINALINSTTYTDPTTGATFNSDITKPA